MLCTLEADRPEASAMPREDQWVAFLGVLSSVLTMTASVRTSSIVRGAPGRGTSRSPSRATTIWMSTALTLIVAP